MESFLIRHRETGSPLGELDCETLRRISHGLTLNLAHGDLRGLDLSGVRWGAADLTHAALQGSNLEGADLRRASLEGADLRGALYDSQTRWPEGFNPEAHGAVWLVP